MKREYQLSKYREKEQNDNFANKFTEPNPKIEEIDRERIID